MCTVAFAEYDQFLLYFFLLAHAADAQQCPLCHQPPAAVPSFEDQQQLGPDDGDVENPAMAMPKQQMPAEFGAKV